MAPSIDIDMPNAPGDPDVVIESDEFLPPPEAEKDDVAIIDPDQSSEEDTSAFRADNVEQMKAVCFPPLHDEPHPLEDQIHTWHIEGWRTLPKKTHGPIFQAGGFPWRILMFPYGNTNSSDSCSFYLEHAFDEETNPMPENWSCCVQFGLVLWNKHTPTKFSHHVAHHRFNKVEGDWGFSKFIETRKLFNPSWNGSGRPLVENDEANITAYVRIMEDETGVLWHSFTDYDSKKETGYVGLKNQGATCYLNSLLQSLYFTNLFRKAVYQIPTEDTESLQNSAYTLQRLFYQLQTSPNAVSTLELTKSFGWETRHVFEQQDVQELSRLLMAKLEERMKDTDAQNFLPDLFSGKERTYISCLHVDYESRKVEAFWDVQLNVSGMKTLEDSFRNYIQVETMDGENQYFAGDEFKLQDARKGVIFESFPQVLHLQLKRFQYDIDKDAMTKLNDRHEFPETFDAAPYLAPEVDRSEPWIYELHGVLVHSGELNAGHYYAFLKPCKDGWWYRYDDDRVTKATKREVLDENFGGEYIAPPDPITGQKRAPLIRQSNAYMLVYIRRSRIDQVLLPVSQDDTPPHLRKKLEEEAAYREAKRKERDEQHLYLNARVVTDDTFSLHNGFDLTHFDVPPGESPSAARQYRLLRTSTIQSFLEQVGSDIGTDPKRLRFWAMVGRQNKTTRPDQPILDTELTVEETCQKHSGKATELRLWAEVAEHVNEDGNAIWPTFTPANAASQANGQPKPDLIVLFLKWFDVEHQRIVGKGYFYVSREKKVDDLTPLILERLGWPEKTAAGEPTQLRLFEEIKPDMIEPMKPRQTLKAAELQDGDIICAQAADPKAMIATRLSDPDAKSISQLAIRTKTDGTESNTTDVSRLLPEDAIDSAVQYYEFLRQKRLIKFRQHPTKNASATTYEPFKLLLSAKFDYTALVTRVSRAIDVPASHLRLWTVNAATDAPKAAVKRGQAQTLHSIMTSAYTGYGNPAQKTDSLYFEVLEMSLSEMDIRKLVKVIWLNEGITREDPYDILVRKQGKVGEIIEGLIKKAQVDDEATAGPIRIYEVSNSKIHRELDTEADVSSISDYIQVVCERMPEEDREAPPNSFMQAFHFQTEPNKPYGIPFKFHIKPHEIFSDTKKRLEKRTGIKGKNFEKIKFAVVKRAHFARAMYLKDDDVLWDVASQDDDMLGLDHVDRSRIVRNGAGDMFLK